MRVRAPSCGRFAIFRELARTSPLVSGAPEAGLAIHHENRAQIGPQVGITIDRDS